MADTECGMAAVAMGLRGKGSGNFFLDPFPLLQNEVCRPRKTIQRVHEAHNWPLTEGKHALDVVELIYFVKNIKPACASRTVEER